MSIVSIVFLVVGILLCIRLVMSYLSAINKKNVSYDCVQATVIKVTPWMLEDPRLDSNKAMYRADLEYIYRGKQKTCVKDYNWETDCNGEFVNLYIDSEQADVVLIEDEYKSANRTSNIVGLLVFNLIFIIPCFAAAYYLLDMKI